MRAARILVVVSALLVVGGILGAIPLVSWAADFGIRATSTPAFFQDLAKGDRVRLKTTLDIPAEWPVPVVAETLRLFFGTSLETGDILRQEPDKTKIDRKNAPFCMIQLRESTLGKRLVRPRMTIEAIQVIPHSKYMTFFTMDLDAPFKALMCPGDMPIAEVETLLGFGLRISR